MSLTTTLAPSLASNSACSRPSPRPAPVTIARALRWVGSLPAEDPAFLWVHLFEPHAPYEAPAWEGAPGAEVNHRAVLAEEPGHRYTDAERTALRARYAAEVTYADAQVGTLLEGLGAAGRLRDAIVVVVGDHGEGLGEHGVDFTHHGLGEEVLRVPMVVWAPLAAWTPGTRIVGQTGVESVAATILTYAGLPGLTGTIDPGTRAMGVDVVEAPLQLEGHDGRGRRVGPLDGIRSSGLKLVRSANGDVLHDLVADPLETHDVGPEQPETLAQARALLEERPREEEAPTDGGPDALLKALGYRE